MQQVYYLFVYGSLRSGFKSPAYDYISKYFSFVAEGKVKGLLYDMGKYPVAKSCVSNHFIKGELYQIKNIDEFSFAIAQLDDYEGIDNVEGNSIFKREKTMVTFENEQTQEAWIYWFAGDINGKELIESGDVLEFMQQQQNK
jgi:gamma-glutamylcyclotransferase (GGCT)/AIG2-like uncharacterized protein YtfP